MRNKKTPILILILILILFFIIFYINNYKIFREKYDNINNINIVIARYNEKLEWLKEEPFNKYNYIVYNKGNNDNYYKSDKFIIDIKLENVGRETHTYLYHIINNYDNLSNLTIFVPGSLDLEIRHDRAKRLFNEIENNKNYDIFACILGDGTFNHNFTLDNWLSTNEDNRSLNTSESLKLSEIRPFGDWYTKVFGDLNKDGKCFTVNSTFALTKETILKKPKSYYENLITYVNEHHNHETVHYFERSWETVFYPYTNVKYVE